MKIKPLPKEEKPTFKSNLRTMRSSRVFVRMDVLHDDHCGLTADSPERLRDFWQMIVAEQPDHEAEKENLVVVLMNSRLRPYAWHRVSVGTANECNAHPREILRPVIVGAASAFALMHNHPSGDPSPSKSDEEVTQRILEASNLMGLRFFDHIIIGSKAEGELSYFSFFEAGVI
jgi:DNA repair protein RadC